MTDEELAEAWIREHTEIIDDEEFGMEYIKKPNPEESYLAGLQVGRKSRWHKVADGDLPEYGVEVLNEDGDKVRYEPAGYSEQYPLLSGWIAYSEYEERDVEIDAPVAWCEVPQYTKEIEHD